MLEDIKLGGSFSCIVYDSFKVTKFGRVLFSLLNACCENVAIEPVGAQPFLGRLIDAVIVSGIKKYQVKDAAYRIEDIDQDNLRTRTELENVSGFVPISDIFETKRGLRLKQTAFFLTNRDKCKQTGATPFVKKIFHVDGYAVSKAHPEAALLVHPDDYNEAVLEELKIRLTAAKKDPDRFQSILNWVKHRPDSWYFHQKPPKAPILFNYYIRNLPRHLLNPIGPYSDNFYGLNWDGDIPAEAVLAIMNSTVVRKEILSRARNQGNGLYKLQLFEYRDVHIPDLRDFDRKTIKKLAGMGAKLIGKSNFPNHIIDNFLFELFPAPELEQEFISKESS